uniref:SAM-dependent methyltransferase n=1 Tax=Strongyloides papillosus TaxID=174720 RepID=A0A0N5BRJ8_STREA
MNSDVGAAFRHRKSPADVGADIGKPADV